MAQAQTPEELFVLGVNHSTGKNVLKDDIKAVEYYQKDDSPAAEKTRS